MEEELNSESIAIIEELFFEMELAEIAEIPKNCLKCQFLEKDEIIPQQSSNQQDELTTESIEFFEDLFLQAELADMAEKDEKMMQQATTTSQKEKNEKCTICIEQFEESQKITFLECSHKFHTECIDPWLESQKNCPNCRTQL